MRVAGVVLAGGKASRMGGGDKGLLPLGNAAVLDHVIERLGPQCIAIAINANDDPGRFARFALPVIADSLPDRPGPLAGILAAMGWAASRGEAWVVTVAADTPFFPLDLVAILSRKMEETGAPVVIAATPDATGALRRHPTFGLWSTGLRDDLLENLARGERKVVAFADHHGAATATFPAGGTDPFFNVNTPEDLAEAQARLA